MARLPSLDADGIRKVFVLRAAPRRWGIRQIAEEMGVSPRTISRYLSGEAPDLRGAMPSAVAQSGEEKRQGWKDSNPPPKHFSELSSLAQDALLDLPLFCDKILGESLYPLQVDWHRDDMEQAAADQHWTLRMGPPRHTKTGLRNRRCVWRAAGGGYPEDYYRQSDPPLRDIRLMLVAGAETQSDKNFEYVQVRLSEHPKLIGEYGRFREPGLAWRPSQRVLTIAGRRRLELSGDFSIVCVGTGSHVLGRGADEILPDDPFDLENCRNQNDAEKLLRWLRVHVFSRLEPGGWVLANGMHLPMSNDPYTQMQNWPAYVEGSIDADELTDPDEEQGGDYPRLFHTTVFPAVLDWTKRIVLSPEIKNPKTGLAMPGTWSWRNLMKARSAAGPDWGTVWMQQDGDSSMAMALHEWIYGGTIQGVPFPGCLDRDRNLGEGCPERLAVKGPALEVVDRIRIVSVDPSGTQFWGVLCMDLPKLGADYTPYLIDINRGRHSTSSIMKLLDEWYERYQYRALVLERNIAKFLIEDTVFLDFVRSRRLHVVFHHTNVQNKDHKDWGRGTLPKDFAAGRIHIPHGDPETRWAFAPLIKEARGELPTDDLLDSLWFPKWNLAGLLIMASSDSGTGWPGWKGSPGRHRSPPARVGKYWAGAA